MTRDYYLLHRNECLSKVKEWRKNNKNKTKITSRKWNLNKKAILGRYKIMKGCLICGFRKSSVALDFHHTNPESKEITIGWGARIKWKRVKEEVKKCVVLCSNCHRMVEAQEIKLSDTKNVGP